MEKLATTSTVAGVLNEVTSSLLIFLIFGRPADRPVGPLLSASLRGYRQSLCNDDGVEHKAYDVVSQHENASMIGDRGVDPHNRAVRASMDTTCVY